MLDWIHYKTLLAMAFGAGVGMLYARLTRCSTGTCPLTSNVWTAGLFGAAIGLLMTLNVAGGQAHPADTKTVTNTDLPAPTVQVAPQQGEKGMARFIESVEDFDRQVLQSPKPVLVDFYATWCGPCRLLTPIMEQLGTELAGRADIVKIDVDKVGELAARYRIMGVPTVMLFDQGKAVKTFVGVRSKADYLNAVQQTVAR